MAIVLGLTWYILGNPGIIFDFKYCGFLKLYDIFLFRVDAPCCIHKQHVFFQEAKLTFIGTSTSNKVGCNLQMMLMTVANVLR